MRALALRVAIVVVTLGFGSVCAAQSIDGYASVMLVAYPQLTPRVTELRSRVFAERKFEANPHIRLTASGFVEGLVADRATVDGPVYAAIVRPQELHAEVSWTKADLRVGLSRLVWGRLDEFQPTDVVNPLDLTRFFLEGRSEARIPVAMVRGRWLPIERFSIEAVYVPVFRRGRFDQLSEDTAPFNPARLVPSVSSEPIHTFSNAQGGVRSTVTTGRVDWSLSAYRGFEPLPLFHLSATGVEETFPRFTMIGGDFETVHGQWGFRGEAAAFVDRTLQVPDRPATVKGTSADIGVGVDRKAGDYRISGNIIHTRRESEQIDLADAADTLLVASVDRSFARETRQVRAFAVYNPGDDSGFARLIASFSIRDNLSIEASGGLFAGNDLDSLSRFANRDFVYLRFKVFF